MNDVKISTWIKNFEAGKYNSADVDTQCEAGWFDWFCRDNSLRNKTYKLAPKLKQIAQLLGVDFMNKNYVFFKNNCPMCGSLYDDFRFCDMKSGDVIYTITPSSGYLSDKGTSTVYGKSNDFKEPLVSGKWADVVEYFKNLKNS